MGPELGPSAPGGLCVLGSGLASSVSASAVGEAGGCLMPLSAAGSGGAQERPTYCVIVSP